MTSQLTEALGPLTEVLSRSFSLRLLARPGWILADRVQGESQLLDIPWTDVQHAAALVALERPQVLDTGVVAMVVDGMVVLHSPADTLWRVDDMAREGWLSPLCGRFLSAALAVGRNILVTGPWPLAVQLMTTLVGEGQKPALLGSPHDAVPRRWVRLSQVSEARWVGADRIAAWSLPPAALAPAMGSLSGAIAWIDAHRLDRALVRYEIGAEQSSARGNTPLHVLAGIDLVVVVSTHGGPRVREVAEISLVAEGYRPALLFASGLPPAPSALMPLAAPSFIEELNQAGHATLADELQHSVVKPSASRAAAPERPPARPGMPTAGPPPGAPPAIRAAPEALAYTHAHAPKAMTPVIEPAPLNSASSPGWELDRLPATEGSEGAPLTTAEEAVMAATYGLGPPPRPGQARGPAAFAGVMRDAMTRLSDEGTDPRIQDVPAAEPEPDEEES